MNRSEFLRIVKEQLPELRQSINQQRGCLPAEMEVLRHYVQRAIFDGDRQPLAVCFRLAEEAYAKGDKRLKNAVDVIFVEDLKFVTPHNKYDWAWEMFPANLKELYSDFYFKLLGRDNPFL
jgi:hypothetical protein